MGDAEGIKRSASLWVLPTKRLFVFGRRQLRSSSLLFQSLFWQLDSSSLHLRQLDASLPKMFSWTLGLGLGSISYIEYIRVEKFLGPP